MANIKIKIAFTDWNQLAGTKKFPINKSVFCLAYTFNNPPACSNEPQKTKIIKKIDNKIKQFARDNSKEWFKKNKISEEDILRRVCIHY